MIRWDIMYQLYRQIIRVNYIVLHRLVVLIALMHTCTHILFLNNIFNKFQFHIQFSNQRTKNFEIN